MKKIVVGFITLIIILITILFQLNVLGQVPFAGVVPNIGIVLITAIAISAGSFVGGITGFFYGLLIDIICGRFIGLNILLYLSLGIASGYLINRVSRDNKMSLAIMVIVGTIAFEVVNCLCVFLMQNNSFSFSRLIYILFFEELYNLFLTVVFFRSFMLWGEVLNKSRNNYYSLVQ